MKTIKYFAKILFTIGIAACIILPIIVLMAMIDQEHKFIDILLLEITTIGFCGFCAWMLIEELKNIIN